MTSADRVVLVMHECQLLVQGLGKVAHKASSPAAAIKLMLVVAISFLEKINQPIVIMSKLE